METYELLYWMLKHERCDEGSYILDVAADVNADTDAKQIHWVKQDIC